ncbi:TonB-dependent receptor [Pseudohongiella sp. SYSU M77423]|uniref:TonB-dependent receptor plug domain-containing protein n=1 Tax=Pseudohongiella sp. SYSU M77423 TaxID=3042312 RepID=UPI0024801471|nr:TonB-dependent receptor [Pseudohongiella sp. SYSU M77423]MDH7943559.1 TonB-dependent receptor [Pseudohongiella sp. SYSU M77423]
MNKPFPHMAEVPVSVETSKSLNIPGFGKRPLAMLVQLSVTGLLLGAGSAAIAQTQTSNAIPEIQEVVVTGSNIRRAENDGTVPVSVIGEEAMEVRAAVLPVDLLTSLPSVVNLPENETRLGSSGARGDNANINLRNMGATATLVLVNGRRMSINPMTAGLSQAVNVNQLPTQGVERIEVLRDGASSIYGSDAVGGVINYIMKREFDGVEVSLQQGGTEHGGGENTQLALTFGSTDLANGRGRFIGSIEALNRDSIALSERDFSRTSFNSDKVPAPFNNLGGSFDGRSARGYWPTFRVGSSTANNYFRPVNGTPTLTSSGPSRANNPEFYLDLNQFGFASPEVKRGNAYLAGEYDISPSVTVFAEAGYYMAESTMKRQPLALNAPTSDKLMVMPIDNPYNPYGSRFYHPTGAANADGTPRLTGQPRTVSFTQMTLAGLSPELITTESDVVRFATGLKGSFGATWTWETSLFYNQVNGNDEAYPDVRESLLQDAIGRTDANAYNPFGYTFRVQGNAVVADAPYNNPRATVDSFSDTFAREAQSYIASFDAKTSGTLFSWWGGDVMAAFGVEHRREDLEDIRPPFSGENPASSGLDTTNNDFLLHPPRPDVFGSRDVTSAFAEVMIPLINEDADIPLMNRLELNVSARTEQYSDFGNTTKPKVGINWKPVDWLMLRASRNEGFMAPSLAALYTSPRWTITAGAGDIDAYRNPALNEGPYVMRTYFGGNPDLKAQESKGDTVGLVFDAPFMDGLTMNVDWWRIRRSNLLGQRSVAQINESDTALLRAYTQQQLAAGVPADQIDLGSGTANYKGDRDVERFALTPEDRAAFAAYNAANPNNPVAPAGRIFSRNRPFLNLSTSEHSGVDFGFRYELRGLSFGDMVFSSEWAYLNKAEDTLAPANVEPTVNNQLYGNGAAKWRSTSNIFWRNGAWNAGLGIYHVGETHDTGATTTQAVYESLGQPDYIEPFFTQGRTVYRRVIDSFVTYNLTVGYQFDNTASPLLRDTRVRVGVINLTDKEPPLSSDNFGYDPSVSQSLLSGRSWNIQLTRRF